MTESRQDMVYSLKLPVVVDASTVPVQIGIPGQSGWQSIASSKEQALEGLFSSFEKVLADTKMDLSKIDSIFFCEGPGSTLGLRIAAAFVRTILWSNSNNSPFSFYYNALDLASYLAPSKHCIIQAPFRMGLRFVRKPTLGDEESIKDILPEDEAIENYPESFHLPDMRKRCRPIPAEQILSYDISKINGLKELLPISRICKKILPYNPKAPEFKKWNPQTFGK